MISLQKATDSPYSDQTIAFLGMAGLITLVKCTSPTVNQKDLLKIWQKICVRTQIPDIFDIKTVSVEDQARLMQILNTWQIWVQFQPKLRRDLLSLAVQEPEKNTPDIVKKY